MSLFLDNVKYRNLIKNAKATQEALRKEEVELNGEYKDLARAIINKYNLQGKSFTLDGNSLQSL